MLSFQECDYDEVGQFYITIFQATDQEKIIPYPKTLAEYDAREFEERTPIFSSFTYFIDLCRFVGTVLSSDNPRQEMEIAVSKGDAMLVNWKLHLPRERQSIVDKNEDVDEMMFVSHHFFADVCHMPNKRRDLTDALTNTHQNHRIHPPPALPPPPAPPSNTPATACLPHSSHLQQPRKN